MKTVLEIIQAETLEPPKRVTDVMTLIRNRHAERVQAMVYYGSSLRELDNPEKMLDFYVLVDSYRKTHGTGIRALLNRYIPPAVYYLEHRSDEDGALSTCKYSILSLSQFEKRCGNQAFLSQVWGRFSQPCAVLWAKDADILKRVWDARVTAVETMANETAPLLNGTATSTELWGRGFYEMPTTGAKPAQRRWFFRRLFGKPAAAIRVLLGAATFDGGIDYIARKVENHSGVKLDPTPAQRKHPVLHSPILFWKIWRKGAFR